MSLHMDRLSNEEKYLVLELSYLNIPQEYFRSGNNIKTLIDKIILDHKEKKMIDGADRIQEKLKKYPELGDLKLIAYRNNNNHDPYSNTQDEPKTGFVGYVLEDKEGNRAFLFRGTEPSTMPKFLEDMDDNLSSTLYGDSPQVREAKKFFNDNRAEGKENLLFGHSKGGNLVSEVFVDNLSSKLKAYVVNGQPINITDLSAEQLKALKSEDFTFIIHKGDVVSGLGIVFYIDKIVNGVPDDAHNCVGVSFNQEGNFASEEAEGISLFREISNIVWIGILGLVDATEHIARYIEDISQYIENIPDELMAAVDIMMAEVDEFGRNVTEIIDQTLNSLAELTSEVIEAVSEAPDLINNFFASAALFLAELQEYALNLVAQMGARIENWLMESFNNHTEEIINNGIATVQERLRALTEQVKLTVNKRFSDIVNSISGPYGQEIKINLGVDSLTLQSVARNARNLFFRTGHSGNMAIKISRLNDLTLNLRRMHNDFDEHLTGDLRLVRSLINSLNAEYIENNVRTASSAVLEEVERIERLYRVVSQKLHEKEITLKRAADKYASTEARLVSDIIKA